MASVVLTPTQINWLQNLVNRTVQDEATSNPAYSGDLANTPTFQQGDFTVAQSVLVAIQTAVE